MTFGNGSRLTTPDRRSILNIGGGQDFQDKGQRGIGFQNDLTFFDLAWHGDHTIKTGVKYKSVRVDAFEQQPYSPQFFYDITQSTSVPYRVEFGSVVPGVGDRNITSRNKQFGIYLQDDWQVNDRLTPAEIDDLHRGDAKVLDRITPNALEQLQLARAYLEAREVHANDPAMDRVLERIVEERHGEDLRHSLSHGEKGITHG